MFPRALCVVLLWLGSTEAAAETDHQLWTSAGVRAQMHQWVEGEVALLSRYDHNITELKNVMHEGELTLEPTKWLDLGVGFRAMMEQSKSGDLEPADRSHVQAALQGGVGPVDLSYRLRFTSKFEPDKYDQAQRIRNRLQARWDIKGPATPLVGVEVYTDPNAESEAFRELAVIAGAGLKFSKRHRLKLKLQMHQELNGDGDTERILNVAYRFVLPKPK